MRWRNCTRLALQTDDSVVVMISWRCVFTREERWCGAADVTSCGRAAETDVVSRRPRTGWMRTRDVTWPEPRRSDVMQRKQWFFDGDATSCRAARPKRRQLRPTSYVVAVRFNLIKKPRPGIYPLNDVANPSSCKSFHIFNFSTTWKKQNVFKVKIGQACGVYCHKLRRG